MKSLTKQLSEISKSLQEESERLHKEIEKYSDLSIEDDSDEYEALNEIQGDVDYIINATCEELENIFDKETNKNLYTSKSKNSNGTYSYLFAIKSEKEMPDVSFLTKKIEEDFYQLSSIKDKSLSLQNYCDPENQNSIEFMIHTKSGIVLQSMWLLTQTQLEKK